MEGVKISVAYIYVFLIVRVVDEWPQLARLFLPYGGTNFGCIEWHVLTGIVIFQTNGERHGQLA